MEPMLWFRYTDRNRHVWRFYLAVEKQIPDLNSALGLCYHKRRDIYIDAMASPLTQAVTVFHEQTHLAVASSNRRIARDQEELVVSAIDAEMMRFAKSLGAKLPRRPRGWMRLREYQRSRE